MHKQTKISIAHSVKRELQRLTKPEKDDVYATRILLQIQACLDLYLAHIKGEKV